MDDTMKVEFPIGKSAVIMRRPSQGQLFAVSVLRKPRENDELIVKHRFTERIIRFLEVLAGPDQWSRIEDGLLSEEITPTELLNLFSDVTQFPWDEHAAPDRPVSEPEAEPEPERRAPRVVSGG